MADNDFNLATLWIPVLPETSKVSEKLQQAGKEGKEKFEESTRGIGDGITKDLEDASKKTSDNFTKTGDHINDVLSKSAKDSADNFSKAGHDAATNFDESFDSLSSKSMVDLGKRLGDRFGGVLGTTVVNNLSKVDPIAEKIGVDISGWTGPLQDAAGEFKNMKDTFDVFSSGVFKDGPGIIGMFGKIGEAVAEVAGPLAAAVVAGKQLADLTQKIPFVHDRFHNDDGTYKNPIDRWASHVPGLSWLVPPIDGQLPSPAIPPPTVGPYGSGPAGALPGTHLPRTGVGTSADPNAIQPDIPNFYQDWYGSGSVHSGGGAAPGGDPNVFKNLPDGGSGPSSTSTPKSVVSPSSVIGGVSGRAGIGTAGSRIANLYALANALQGTPYSQALRNDCSGMVAQLASVAAGLPDPSPGERFTTVNEGESLAAMGFQPGIGPPGSLRVGWYDHGGGNAGHTAMTLPGGEHAESGGSHGNFLVGPGAAGADNPEFTNHAWLPMSGRAGSINGSDGGAGAMPSGTENDPLYVSQSTSGAGGNSTESQGQQLGKGMAGGLLQEFGLDGSVFKGFGGSTGNPAHFGITQLGTGIANVLGNALQSGGAGGSDGASLGAASGSGVGGMLGGLGQLMPGSNANASVSNGAVAVGPGGAQNVPSTSTTNNFFGDVHPLTVNQSGVTSPATEMQHAQNGAANRTGALAANLPGK